MASNFRRITIKRTPCDGVCPVYEATVSGTGEVEYFGEQFVSREGMHRWKISERRVRLLAEAFEKANYSSLEERYTSYLRTAAPSCLTSIEYENGYCKSVEHYHGDRSAPEELTRLEERIDAIAGINKYVRIKETNPTTYLLTWNPSKHYRWEDLEADIEDIKSGFYKGSSWSCGVTRRIIEGDRVFLMRLGDEPRGIVASGRVEWYDLFHEGMQPVRPGSDVYEAPYWEDQSEQTERSGKTALYVNVRWDTLLNPERRILPLSELEELNEGLPEGKKQKWTPQNSGITIRDDVASRLEALWEEYLAIAEGG